ncbi:unnamed protein product [[Candida] anglica]
MSVTSQQQGRLYLNNFQGQKFPLSQGTRQGNPISPILFNLALEPFLFKISNLLSGIPIPLQMGGEVKADYLAFADDVTVFLRTEQDFARLKQEINTFERVSNSLINNKKSSILYFGDTPPHHIQHILPYPMKPSTDLDIRYLGILINKFSWTEFIESLRKQLSANLIRGLPLHLRAQGLNSYAFSKLYFRDLHHPMTTEDILELTKVTKRFFPGIGGDTVYALKKQGGYGLLKLEDQLLGRRAKVIYHALTNKDDWNYVIFRDKLQHYINKFARIPSNVSVPVGSKAMIPWFRFLTGTRIMHVSGGELHKAIERETDDTYFSTTEQAWIQAWFAIAVPKPPPHSLPPLELPTTFTTTEQSQLREAPLPSSLPVFMQGDSPLVNEATFKSRHRQTQLRKPHIIPQGWERELSIGSTDWKKFWKQLNKVKLKHPEGAEELHRFNLGHRAHGNTVTVRHNNTTILVQSRRSRTMQIQSTNDNTEHVDSRCVACLTEMSSAATDYRLLQHMYSECTVSRQIWEEISRENLNLSIKLLVANSTLSILQYLNVNRYLQAIHRFFRERRQTSTALRTPLTSRDITAWVTFFKSTIR